MSLTQVTPAMINASGTPSSTTYLRGDGSWATAGSVSNVQTFDSTGTWTKPTTGQTMARIQVWGGGGGSARYTSAGNTYTGSGGGYNEFTTPLSNLASTVTATVGSGGAAATTTAANGGTGGTSSFAIATAVNGVTIISATGGRGGLGDGGGAGIGGFPTTNLSTDGTLHSIYYGGVGTFSQGQGNSSIWGGGGGSAGPAAAGTTIGGQSMFGGAGGTATTSVGNAGTQPGGGGGAAYNANVTGGAGAAGRIIITCW